MQMTVHREHPMHHFDTELDINEGSTLGVSASTWYEIEELQVIQHHSSAKGSGMHIRI